MTPSRSIEHPLHLAAVQQLASSTGAKFGAIVVGCVVLTASSYLQIPLVPVPMTLQTLAVTLIGALYGWRLGAATVLVWLTEALLGLPVLAGGAGGAAHFIGPTAGYLLAFPLAAGLTGWLVERGWDGQRVVLACLSMLLGNALCLAFGAAWLASFVGMTQAIALGVAPFLVGAALKSIMGAAILRLVALSARGAKPN